MPGSTSRSARLSNRRWRSARPRCARSASTPTKRRASPSRSGGWMRNASNWKPPATTSARAFPCCSATPATRRSRRRSPRRVGRGSGWTEKRTCPSSRRPRPELRRARACACPLHRDAFAVVVRHPVDQLVVRVEPGLERRLVDGHGDHRILRGHVVPHQVEHLLVALLRSEEHTSELQSREKLVCRLLLEKK